MKPYTHWLGIEAVLLTSLRQGKTSRYCATSTRLTLVVWDAGVPHGLETSCPVTNGFRAALVIFRSPRYELAKRSNAASRRSPPFLGARVDKRDEHAGSHTPKRSH